jgi:hypothetical protein
MYFVRSVDHPSALVSGQRAHVVIAGFVAKPLDGVVLRSSAPFLRNAKTTGLWFISQIDLKGESASTYSFALLCFSHAPPQATCHTG